MVDYYRLSTKSNVVRNFGGLCNNYGPQSNDQQEQSRQFNSKQLGSRCWFKLWESDCE